jgi:hypothetical protein
LSRVVELMKLYVAQPRRRHQRVTANISTASAAGSDATVFELTLAPQPTVSPGWDCQLAGLFALRLPR